MAGKTFPGIGDLEDESPPLDPADAADSSSSYQAHYSGPTVVDEAKVEQGLKKLRSLDAPPGPMTGIHRAVTDAIDDPARLVPTPAAGIPPFNIEPSRGTAVGRSVSGPIPGQQTTQPMDDRAMRGTMFGHGVHRPAFEDIQKEIQKAKEAETSKALAVVERGAPTTNEIAVFRPGAYVRPGDFPPLADPYPRARNFHAFDTPSGLQITPRRKVLTRVLLAAAAMGLIVVAAVIYVRSTGEESEANAPAAQPAPLPRPSLIPPPPGSAAAAPAADTTAGTTGGTTGGTNAGTAPAGTAPAAGTAATAKAEPGAAAKPARPASDETDTKPGATLSPPPRPERAAADVSPAPHRTSRPAAERRHAPAQRSPSDAAKRDKGASSDEAEPAPKPSRTKRPVEEDPDATLAPTIE
jgi:hypothetical protein